ncbi:hypothetical protein Dimus_017826 [Dionaea muscipula]
MDFKRSSSTFILIMAALVGLMVLPSKGLMPFFSRSLWDIDDPFRFLDHHQAQLTPLTKNNNLESLLGARADWKETQTAHIISLDIPGMSKEDIKIELDESSRVLMVSGERRSEVEEEKGDMWHRVERISGKFLRQFRLPGNADLEGIKAKLENEVLRITVPKVAEEDQRSQISKVIKIMSEQDDDLGEGDASLPGTAAAAAKAAGIKAPKADT